MTAARLRRRRARAGKKPSTALIQEAEAGVKWNTHRGCRASQARTLFGVLVGFVGVDDGMDRLARRHGTFDRVEEADELPVAVALQATAEDGAVEDLDGGEERRDAVAPTRRATSATGSRSEDKRTIRARSTRLSGRLRSPTTAARRGVRGANDHRNIPCHAPRLAPHDNHVNLLFMSVH